MPAIFQLVIGGGLPKPARQGDRLPRRPRARCRSRVAIVLLVTYVAGLFFSLKTHRDLFNPAARRGRRGGEPLDGPARASIALAIAGVAVGVMSEILVGSIAEASASIGLSPFFVGADRRRDRRQRRRALGRGLLRLKDKMDLSVNIAIGSSAQIALFVAPVLVLLSFFVGPFPMALVFNGLELGAILLRGADRQLGDARGRVDLVRGRAAARRLRRARAHLLLRGVDPTILAASRRRGRSSLTRPTTPSRTR